MDLSFLRTNIRDLSFAYNCVQKILSILGGSAIIMSIALMAYGREELHHENPETDVYKMEVDRLMEPDFKEAFLDVRKNISLFFTKSQNVKINC